MKKLIHIIYINYCKIFNIKTYHFKKNIKLDIDYLFVEELYLLETNIDLKLDMTLILNIKSILNFHITF